jgi:DNA polymerase-1
MYIERILHSGYYTHFSLDAVVRRYLHRYMEKDTRETFIGATQLTREQIEYAALDAASLLEISHYQRKLMNSTLFNVWAEIDRRAVWAFLDFKGFPIDVAKWTALMEHHRALQEELLEKVPFNPNSPQQVMAFLKANGIKAKDTVAGTLEKIADQTKDPFVKGILNDVILSRHYGKLASTYGSRFIADFLEKDGENDVIVGDYKPNGAETGRTACEHPNMQNIPVRESPAFRECFIAKKGHKLIIVDFDSQEPRNTAILSGEPKLIDWINAGKDIYIEFARDVFNMELSKSDPRRSDMMKPILLGGNYGMTEYGLAKRLQCSVAEALEIIKKRDKALPVLAKYMDKQREIRDVVYTISGRPIYLNGYNPQAERNALNGPVQGSAGDQMKVAMADVHTGWSSHSYTDFPVVAYVHDELVSSTPAQNAEDDAQYIKETMEKAATAMAGGIIKFTATAKIGENWAAKK